MSNQYNDEVGFNHTKNVTQVENFFGSPSLGSQFDKFIADYMAESTTNEFETKAEITERLLNNQLNSNEAFDDTATVPDYGPPGVGGKIIGNEKEEHNGQPTHSASGSANDSLLPGGKPPGSCAHEPQTFEDGTSVAKKSKLTEEDETRVSAAAGSHQSELSLMLDNASLVYVKSENIRYSDTSAGGEGGKTAAKEFGKESLRQLRELQFSYNNPNRTV
jgi:hypothetical protein